MALRNVLLLTAVILASTTAAGASDPGSRQKAATPGRLLQSARRASTLMDRIAAIRELGAIRDRESLRQWRVVAALAEFAGDAHPRVARAALVALRSLYQFDPTIKTEVRGPLVALFRDPARHVLIRREAAGLLGAVCRAGELSDRNAVQLLAASTKPSRENPPEVCAAAIRALGNIGDPIGKAAIREALTSTDATIRNAGIDAIVSALQGEHGRKFHEPRLASILLELVGNDSVPAASRNKAAEAIGILGSMDFNIRGGESPFIKVLNESDDTATLVSALKALALSGSVKAATAFPLLFDRFTPGEKATDDAGRVLVRATACAMAGELFIKWAADQSVPGTAARPLVNMLGKAIMDNDREVASQSAVALGNLYDPKYDRTKATAFLVALLGAKGVDAKVRELAVESLEIISGRALGSDAAAWEKWFRDNVRFFSAR